MCAESKCSFSLKELNMKNNFVAKHMNTINRNSIHKNQSKLIDNYSIIQEELDLILQDDESKNIKHLISKDLNNDSTCDY